MASPRRSALMGTMAAKSRGRHCQHGGLNCHAANEVRNDPNAPRNESDYCAIASENLWITWLDASQKTKRCVTRVTRAANALRHKEDLRSVGSLDARLRTHSQHRR